MPVVDIGVERKRREREHVLAVVHPKDEALLIRQAHENVTEDLELLSTMARRRMSGNHGVRTKFLAQHEFMLLERCLVAVRQS